jgi:branched-chain amino acid transport system ATP-binding protein/branched-chain amino acid transport system permease protein
MSLLNRITWSRRTIVALALAAALVAAPGLLPAYGVDILVLAFVFGILAVGLDVLMGYTGMDSLGQGAFFGTAAYTLGILTVKSGTNWFAAAGLAVLLATSLAGVIGLLAVRLRGLYFLLITLAFGQVLWGGALRWGNITGGFNGLSGVPRPFRFLSDVVVFAYVTLVIFVLIVVAIKVIVSSPFGLALQGCRDNEDRLRTLGFRPFQLRWLAFVIAGATAGLAGVMNATYNNFVSPSDLSLTLSFSVMLMVIMGGAGNIAGAVVGAAIVTALQYGLSIYIEDWWLLLLGVVYMVTTMFLPKGVVGAFRTIGRQRVPPEVIETPVLGPALAGKDRIAPPLPLELPATDARKPASSSSQVLALESVSKAFGGIKVLDKVTVSFEQGERTAIIGPNGAGKTTLFNLITGLEPVSEGRIAVLGTDVTRRPAYARPALGMGRTFQVTRLFPPLTVLDNMILGLLGWSAREYQFALWRPTSMIRELQDRAREELTTMGLQQLRDIPVRELSYGHQKQLDIAMALACRPKVLLLDEPTAGLSRTEALTIVDFVKALPDQITVIIIEHNLDFLFRLTDRLIVLDHGTILIDGPQQAVRNSEDVRRIYFGATV